MRAIPVRPPLVQLLLAVLLLIILSPVLTDASSWVRVFGGEEDDIGWAIKATPDGGYIVVGETTSYGAGGRDALLMKLDSQGNLLWSKTLGGSLSDAAFDVCVTADGGCAVTGLSYNFNTATGGGWATPWLLRLDPSGNVLWEKYYIRQASSLAYGISQTRDGGFILAGQWTDIPFLLKVDSAGNIQWQRAYGGTVTDWSALTRAVETPDGGFAAAGWYWGGDWQHDFVEYLLKVDSTGQILWQRQFQDHHGYSVGDSITTSDVINAPDGALVFAGGNPAMVWKLDQHGNALWAQRVTTSPGAFDTIDLTAVLPAPEGGYYGVGQYYMITGCYPSPGCGKGTLLVKLSEEGALEWEKVYEADLRTPYETGACLAADGDVLITGATGFAGSDFLVMKVGADGSFSDPCVAILDPGLSWSQEPAAIQDAAAAALDGPCTALAGAILPRPVFLDSAGTICPVIRSVRVLQNPFRLDIRGVGFAAYTGVHIDGIGVPAQTQKSYQQFIAKKGAALKAMLPKGQPVCVTINGQSGWDTYKSACFTFTR